MKDDFELGLGEPVKIVWKDRGEEKALKGTFEKETERFVKIRLPDKSPFVVNKEHIVTVMRIKEGYSEC